MPDTGVNVLGMRIRQLRKQQGLRQWELAERIGLTRAAVGHYEDSARRQPDLNTLVKLADALHTTTDYLLGRTDDSAAQAII
ncbi:helix-turn-helix domain-containing protein [Paenibacillus sp. SAF-054]|uniref:helix-turn-helix domain-containing protein n=1 Tax=unclassified Paenibacillus TaxID=185978 RepID=UPI003F7F6397